MEGADDSLADVIHAANFPLFSKQASEIENVQIAGHAKNATYIQAGTFWFTTLCISMTTLFVVFASAVRLFTRILDNRTARYERILYHGDSNSVHIEGTTSDEEDDHDDDETTPKDDSSDLRAFPKRIIPIRSCVALMACVILICLHCLIRVLYSYKRNLQDRTPFFIIQMCLSASAWIPSTLLPFFYTRCIRAHPPTTTTCIQWPGHFLLYQLQWESIWCLHVVTTILLFDDILLLVAAKSFDVESQEGVSMTSLLYIWMAMFGIYFIILALYCLWFDKDGFMLPHILMLIVLCEIPTRNYKLMDEDAASLGTSGFGILILMCLTAQIVHSLARRGAQCVPHFKSA